ncbi:MAG: chaplin family protein [Streptosporangiaceae bacterium]
MHAFVRRGLQAALLVGAGGVLFAAQASAETTNGSQSLTGGNQVTAPISAPVTVSGNAVSALGSNAKVTSAPASSTGSPGVAPTGSSQTTSGTRSIGGGNQVDTPVSAAVAVSHNAIAVGGSRATVTSRRTPGSTPGSAPSTAVSGSRQTTSGSRSLAGGNQVNAPLNAPVTVSGNAISALGSIAKVRSGPSPSADSTGSAPTGSAAGGSTQTTSGSGSILGGNQVNAPITAPVLMTGNAIALLGSNALVSGGSPAGFTGSAPGGSTQTTSGSGSILGGNQVNAPISAPLSVMGNAIAVGGSSATVIDTGAVGAGGGNPGGGNPGGGSLGTSASRNEIEHGAARSSLAAGPGPLAFVRTAFAAASRLIEARAALAMQVLPHTGTEMVALIWAIAFLLLGGFLLTANRIGRLSIA